MRMTGTVKSFKTRNGSGFILVPGSRDVFVHVSNILDNVGDPSDLLVVGEEVEFDLVEGRRGPAAHNVRRLAPETLSEFTGRIKKYLSNEGYGFIGTESGEVYFHCTDLLSPTVRVGEEVSYLRATSQGKHRAIRIIRR